jgi:hypothetical protein
VRLQPLLAHTAPYLHLARLETRLLIGSSNYGLPKARASDECFSFFHNVVRALAPVFPSSATYAACPAGSERWSVSPGPSSSARHPQFGE